MYRIRVIPDDDKPYTLESSMRDVLAWEKQKPGRAAQQLSENIHLADLYWVAHRAAKRQGLYGGTLKEFEDSCDVVVLGQAEGLAANLSDEDAADGADPTQLGR